MLELFQLSWLGVFHVKGHLGRHSCSNDVTLCTNILSNLNFSSLLSFLLELYTIQRSYHQL